MGVTGMGVEVRFPMSPQRTRHIWMTELEPAGIQDIGDSS